MTDVFISYSKTNEPAVRQLADAVRRLGYSVWWDDELPPHLSYSDVITDRIGEARAAIVIWSESAAASQWVRAEADLARNQKKLIQASIDGRMPPMPFNQIQCAAIGDWQGEEDHPGWLKVKASLAALVGPREPTAVTAPPPAAAAAPHKWHKLLIGVIALSFLFIAGAGLFAWLRGGAPATPTARPAADIPEPPAPAARQEAPPKSTVPATHRAAEARPRTATARPTAAAERAPLNMRGARRYCMGPGRATPECAEPRTLHGRRR